MGEAGKLGKLGKMAASRAVLGRKLCRRYQVFFYVALILVVFQIVLFFSFCSINLSPTPNNQIARLDFAQSQKLRRGLANSESKAAAQLDEHDAEVCFRSGICCLTVRRKFRTFPYNVHALND